MPPSSKGGDNSRGVRRANQRARAAAKASKTMATRRALHAKKQKKVRPENFIRKNDDRRLPQSSISPLIHDAYRINKEAVLKAFTEAKKARTRAIYVNNKGEIVKEWAWPSLGRNVSRPASKRFAGRPDRLPLDIRILRAKDIRYVILYLRVSNIEQTFGDSLEVRLQKALDFLDEQNMVVLAIVWDDIEGDVPFDERAGWPIAQDLLFSYQADAILVPRIERWSRHVRQGLMKAWWLNDRGRPLVFFTQDKSPELHVADTNDQTVHDLVYGELRKAADWLFEHRQKLDGRRNLIASLREWLRQSKPGTYHQLEGPADGRSQPRVRKRVRSEFDPKAVRHAEIILAGRDRAAVQKAAKLARMSEFTYRDYWLDGLPGGNYAPGNGRPVFSKLLQVVPASLAIEVRETLAATYPGRKSRLSVVEELEEAYGTLVLLGEAEAVIGCVCVPCKEVMKLISRGSWMDEKPDIFGCKKCKKTKKFPLHFQWGRFPPPIVCRVCGRPLVACKQTAYPYGIIILDLACENEDCGTFDWLAINTTLRIGKAAYLRILTGVKRRKGLVAPARPAFERVRTQDGRGFPTRRTANEPPPIVSTADLAMKPKADKKKSWLSDRSRAHLVYSPEMREAAQVFVRNHDGFTVMGFARRFGFTANEVTDYFNGWRIPVKRARELLLQFPEFAVLHHVDLLRSRWGRANFGGFQPLASKDFKAKHPDIYNAMQGWFAENGHKYGGTWAGVRRAAKLPQNVISALSLGKTRGRPETRKRAYDFFGLDVFRD